MSIAERFGATVSLALPGKGLFLLVVRQANEMAALVRQAQGQLVSQLTTHRALVLMPLPSYLQLKGSASLDFIGPVNIDQERFAKVMGAHRSAPIVPPIAAKPHGRGAHQGD